MGSMVRFAFTCARPGTCAARNPTLAAQFYPKNKRVIVIG